MPPSCRGTRGGLTDERPGRKKGAPPPSAPASRRGWCPRPGRWVRRALGAGGGTAPHGHAGSCAPHPLSADPEGAAAARAARRGAAQVQPRGRLPRGEPSGHGRPRADSSRSAGGCVGGYGLAAPRKRCPAPSEHTDPLRRCGGQRSGSRQARGERSKAGGNPGQRPLPLPPPPLAWLGSVARKTWQAMGESGLSGCALIR